MPETNHRDLAGPRPGWMTMTDRETDGTGNQGVPWCRSFWTFRGQHALSWMSRPQRQDRVLQVGRLEPMETSAARAPGYGLAALLLVAIHLVPDLAGRISWEQPWDVRGSTSLQVQPETQTIGSGFPSRYFATRQFLARHARQGTLPLWNPHSGLGVPLALEAEFQLFHPLEWVFWLGGTTWWSLCLAVLRLAAFSGTFEFLRRVLNLSGRASFAGGIVFALSGYSMWMYLYPAFLVAVSVVPFMFWFGGLIAGRGPKAVWASAFGLGTGLLFLTGQPQIIVLSAALVAAFSSALVVTTCTSWQECLRRLGTLAVSGTAGIVLSAPQTLPLFWDQVRGDIVSGHEIQSVSVSMGYERVTSMMNMFNPISVALNVGPGTYWFENPVLASQSVEDFALSLGVVPSALLLLGTLYSVLAIGSCFVQRTSANASIGVISVLFWGVYAAIGLAAFRICDVWKYDLINLPRYAVPVLTLFSACVIAWSVERIGSPRWRKGDRAMLLGSLAGVLLVLVLQMGLIVTHPASVIDLARLGEANSSHSLALGVCLAVGCGLGAYLQAKRRAEWILAALLAELLVLQRHGLSLGGDWGKWLILIAAVFGMIQPWRRNGISYSRSKALVWGAIWAGFWVFAVRGTEYDRDWAAPRPEIVAKIGLEERAGYRPRIIAMEGSGLAPDWSTAEGLDSFSANLAAGPATFSALLWSFIRPEALDGGPWLGQNCLRGISAEPRPLEVSGRPEACLIHLEEYFSARWLLSRLGVSHLAVRQTPFQMFREQAKVDSVRGVEGFRKVASAGCPEVAVAAGGGCIEIFRDETARPRAYFTDSYAVVPFTRDAWAAREVLRGRPVAAVVEIRDSDLPMRRLVTVAPSSSAGSGRIVGVEISSYGPNEVRVEVDAEKPGLLVLNDLYHPFWRVRVNGREKPLARVDASVRGVFVEAGRSSVEFDIAHYWRPTYWIALGMAALLLGGVLLPERKAIAREVGRVIASVLSWIVTRRSSGQRTLT